MARYQGWYFMQVKKIVMKHQSAKIDGYFIDVQSANLIVQMYQRASHQQQMAMMQHPISYIAERVWRAVRV